MGKALRGLIFTAAVAAAFLLPACSGNQPPLPTADATAEVVIAVSAPTPTQKPAPPPTPSPTPVPPPDPFSLIWISDTQIYSRRNPDVFTAMTQWIVENRETLNIRYVLHTGDVVDSPFSVSQWENAEASLSQLEGQVPLFVVAGNHDMTNKGDYKTFLNHDCIQKSLIDGQTFRNGEGAYALFSAGEHDFIVIGVGFGIDNGFYAWARDVLKQYADRTAILITHSALENDGTFTREGYRLSTRLIAEAPNIRLVLCGHFRGAATHTETYIGEDGEERFVPFLMYNYQDDEEWGLGYLRILRFEPASGCVSVQTFSPFLNDYTYSDLNPELDTFTIENLF